MKKLIATILASLSVTLLAPLATFAHVVVTPNQATTGQRTLFTVSVPNERSSDVTKLKLLIPKGLQEVQPNVMAGWTISTEKTDNDVSSITWTGTIPEGQRADFVFKAQVSAASGELDWKAYQTYSDNTLVSWDQAPTATETDNDDATTGPYSVTKVTATADSSAQTSQNDDNNTLTLAALAVSIVAIVMSIFALIWRSRK
jgi:uncharacterized protein YcnI